MAVKKVQFGFWLCRVLAWDGLLPAVVWLIPGGLALAMPKLPDAIAVAAVVLPTVALCVRIYVGRHFIASNTCGAAVQECQVFCFYLGIFLLFFLDAFFVIIHMPVPGMVVAVGNEWLVLGALIGVYILLMTIAMYPGRSMLIDNTKA